MNKRILLFFLLGIGLVSFNLAAGENTVTIKGVINGIEMIDDCCQDTVALANANVFWQNTTIGTTTNNDGQFQLVKPDSVDQLIINYVGYQNDTLTVRPDAGPIIVYLNELRSTAEVAVTAERPNMLMNPQMVINTQTITESGLQTLACCNLAESFENTAAVDVEQTDAVSGAKRIKMLGLAGFYTQMMVEKVPSMRGLISPYGLDFIPGFWIESIDISKGTASVSNGYESITGQINVELKKPEEDIRLDLNAYQSNSGRSELTLATNKHLSPNVSTMLLSYGSYNQTKWDDNSDSFIDMPLTTHVNVFNRWKFIGKRTEGQVGFKYIHDERDGGQTHFDFNNPGASHTVYGSNTRTRRLEFFSKTGMMLGDNGSSIGLILSAFKHNLDAFWGRKNYRGDESSFYANLIFETSAGGHDFTSGLTFTGDKRAENYQGLPFNTNESVPGAFVEYTYSIEDRLTAIAGLRYDRHNLYGDFTTPRLHLKYQPAANTSLRFSVGKGYRAPHIFVDNPSILASSKELVIVEKLRAEEGWNAGIGLVQDFQLGTDRPAALMIDFYRTDFVNQVVVDMEQNPRQVLLYNLDGQSFSNSAQIELTATVVRGFEVTTAYRHNDVRTTYQGELAQAPLNNKHKGLLVFSVAPADNPWQFDFTAQFNGKSRLPNTSLNPASYQLPSHSPAYMMLFTQVTRKFSGWELYAGVENITDYRQPNPILAWNEPFGPYFDSSIIWGPTVGRRMYMGLRIN